MLRNASDRTDHQIKGDILPLFRTYIAKALKQRINYKKSKYRMNRREIIKTAALAGLGSLTATTLQADAMPQRAASAGHFRTFKLGQLDLTTFSDGHLYSSPVQPLMTPRAPLSELKKLLEDNFRPSDAMDLSMNVMLVRSATKLILIDPGMGKVIGLVQVVPDEHMDHPQHQHDAAQYAAPDRGPPRGGRLHQEQEQ
ncbi:MAG: hypothetical protein EOO88_50400 [Pedobacter sp.]|nr:MAG: hypothetical protein EOO88_50400 [Pedobacter sp.]